MYWPLLNMYSENFGFGPGGFFLRGTILIRGKGLLCRVTIIGTILDVAMVAFLLCIIFVLLCFFFWSGNRYCYVIVLASAIGIVIRILIGMATAIVIASVSVRAMAVVIGIDIVPVTLLSLLNYCWWDCHCCVDFVR